MGLWLYGATAVAVSALLLGTTTAGFETSKLCQCCSGSQCLTCCCTTAVLRRAHAGLQFRTHACRWPSLLAGGINFETRGSTAHDSRAWHMHGVCRCMDSSLAATTTTPAQALLQHSLAHVRAAHLRIEAVAVLLDAAGALALAPAQMGRAHHLAEGSAGSKKYTGTHWSGTVLVHAALWRAARLLTTLQK